MCKHWKTYLLGICALLIGSCTESELLVDIPEPVKVNSSRKVPISFAGSFVDHATTRHFDKLCQHLPTMGVWGWCIGSKDTNNPVFTDQFVAYNADSARWEYSPLQYWREGCSYTFCAYAPHQQQTDAVVSIDPSTRMISIRNVALHGHNLQDTPTDSTKELFTNTPDIDWMVARAGQTAIGNSGMDVDFMMQHILSKLNIRIKVDSTFLRMRFISHFTVDSIVVGSLAAKGDFMQQLSHTPILTDPNEASINEWTVSDTTLTIKSLHACTISGLPTYLVESLVLPQYISPEATVTFYYSIHFGNGHTEECRYRITLTDAFTRFATGHNYTLTFILNPQRIIFEAGSADWKKYL